MPTILIIDDDLDTRVMLTHALKNLECSIIACDNGKDALERLANLQPDVIILDLALPYMRGEDILALIRQEPHLTETKVIIYTAHARMMDNMALQEADLLLEKPALVQQLRNAVAQFLI